MCCRIRCRNYQSELSELSPVISLLSTKQTKLQSPSYLLLVISAKWLSLPSTNHPGRNEKSCTIVVYHYDQLYSYKEAGNRLPLG